MKKLALLFLLMTCLLASACSKKVIENQSEIASEPEPAVLAEPEPPAPEPQPQVATVDPDAREKFQNELIYFDFDSSVIRPEAQSVLQLKSHWLQDNPEILSVAIEGHCDERGTEAYNLALGSRRAEAVKNFMHNVGVGNCSLETLSFGEEKPVDMSQTEEAYAKNRRVAFVIN